MVSAVGTWGSIRIKELRLGSCLKGVTVHGGQRAARIPSAARGIGQRGVALARGVHFNLRSLMLLRDFLLPTNPPSDPYSGPPGPPLDLPRPLALYTLRPHGGQRTVVLPSLRV